MIGQVDWIEFSCTEIVNHLTAEDVLETTDFAVFALNVREILAMDAHLTHG